MKLSNHWPHLGLFAAIFAAALIMLWPLLRGGFYISDDGEWMVIRLSAFFQSLREGQFPVRFLGRLNHSYGYPVANFLYPGFLYVGSFLHGIGLSFVGSVKGILVGSVVASAYFLFFWLRTFFSSQASFIGVLGFLYAPYMLFDIYKRGSVGEIFILPAVAAALWAIEKGKAWIVAIAVAWLVIGHNSMALLFLPFILGYIAYRKKFHLLPACILGIFLVTFFWLPALVEKNLVLFDLVIVSKPSEYFREGNFLNLLGAVNILAIGFLLFSQKKAPAGKNFFLIWAIISIIFSTTLSEWAWNSPLLVAFVQFPFRFLALGLFAGAWLLSLVVTNTRAQHQWKLFILFGLIWIVGLIPAFSSITFVDRPEGYYSTNEGTTTVADEYVPRWVQTKPTERISRKIVIAQGEGVIEDSVISTQKISATIQAVTKSVVRVNTIFYPGWGVLVDGVPVPVYFDNPQGLIEFDIPAGRHEIALEFRETPVRLLADFISVISFFTLVMYMIYKKYLIVKG